jgi:hypothetical protein
MINSAQVQTFIPDPDPDAAPGSRRTGERRKRAHGGAGS